MKANHESLESLLQAKTKGKPFDIKKILELYILHEGDLTYSHGAEIDDCLRILLHPFTPSNTTTPYPSLEDRLKLFTKLLKAGKINQKKLDMTLRDETRDIVVYSNLAELQNRQLKVKKLPPELFLLKKAFKQNSMIDLFSQQSDKIAPELREYLKEAKNDITKEHLKNIVKLANDEIKHSKKNHPYHRTLQMILKNYSIERDFFVTKYGSSFIQMLVDYGYNGSFSELSIEKIRKIEVNVNRKQIPLLSYLSSTDRQPPSYRRLLETEKQISSYLLFQQQLEEYSKLEKSSKLEEEMKTNHKSLESLLQAKRESEPFDIKKISFEDRLKLFTKLLKAGKINQTELDMISNDQTMDIVVSSNLAELQNQKLKVQTLPPELFLWERAFEQNSMINLFLQQPDKIAPELRAYLKEAKNYITEKHLKNIVNLANEELKQPAKYLYDENHPQYYENYPYHRTLQRILKNYSIEGDFFVTKDRASFIEDLVYYGYNGSFSELSVEKLSKIKINVYLKQISLLSYLLSKKPHILSNHKLEDKYLAEVEPETLVDFLVKNKEPENSVKILGELLQKKPPQDILTPLLCMYINTSKYSENPKKASELEEKIQTIWRDLKEQCFVNKQSSNTTNPSKEERNSIQKLLDIMKKHPTFFKVFYKAGVKEQSQTTEQKVASNFSIVLLAANLELDEIKEFIKIITKVTNTNLNSATSLAWVVDKIMEFIADPIGVLKTTLAPKESMSEIQDLFSKPIQDIRNGKNIISPLLLELNRDGFLDKEQYSKMNENLKISFIGKGRHS